MSGMSDWKLLNLGCGAVRPPPPWVNVDTLFQVLPWGTPERAQLQSEPNYVEADLRHPLPFASDHFDGALASHVFEHFDALALRGLVAECHRVLKPGGVLLVSVPDASYHRQAYPMDRPENALELFGETMPPNCLKRTFLEYALFFDDHRQVFCEDSLWATLVNGGFRPETIARLDARRAPEGDPVTAALHGALNRRKFSLVMMAGKLA